MEKMRDVNTPAGPISLTTYLRALNYKFNMDLHSHHCFECGHTFTHDGDCAQAQPGLHHHCPRCHAGPWLDRVRED